MVACFVIITVLIIFLLTVIIFFTYKNLVEYLNFLLQEEFREGMGTMVCCFLSCIRGIVAKDYDFFIRETDGQAGRQTEA